MCFTKPLFHYAYLLNLSTIVNWLNNGIKSFSTPSFFHNSLLLLWFVFWFWNFVFFYSWFHFLFTPLWFASRFELWCSFTRDLLSTLEICFSILCRTHFCVLLLVICYPLSFFIVPFYLMISWSNPHFLHLTGFRFCVVVFAPRNTTVCVGVKSTGKCIGSSSK